MASTTERIYVVRSGASAITSTPVAMVAGTAKTVIGVVGSATDTICLKRVRVSFNSSVTATDAPALVEVGIISAAGTATAFTPVQIVGATLNSSVANAGYNCSVEPTLQPDLRVALRAGQQRAGGVVLPAG